MDILALVLIFVVVVALSLGVRIVPQSQNFLVERLGRFHRTLGAGLHIIIPVVDTVRHKVNILERQLPTRSVSTITLDNVNIQISLAILYRVLDPARAVYRIMDVDQAIQTTVTGVVRSVIGRTDLDGVQSNRREISEQLEAQLRTVTEEWGIELSRVELIDVEVDAETRSAMQLQLNAERTRRALVREAEGKKQAAELAADAELYTAQRQAEARRTLAEADAYAVGVVAEAVNKGGLSALEFEVKKIQADAIRALGSSESSKLVIVPSDVLDGLKGAADIAGNVAAALSRKA